MSKDSQISPLEDGSIGPNSATKHISSNTIGLSSHELMNPATQCELHTPSSSKILQSYYLRHDKISLSKVSNHLRAVPPAEVLPRHSLTHSINPQSDNFKKRTKCKEREPLTSRAMETRPDQTHEKVGQNTELQSAQGGFATIPSPSSLCFTTVGYHGNKYHPNSFPCNSALNLRRLQTLRNTPCAHVLITKPNSPLRWIVIKNSASSDKATDSSQTVLTLKLDIAAHVSRESGNQPLQPLVVKSRDSATEEDWQAGSSSSVARAFALHCIHCVQQQTAIVATMRKSGVRIHHFFPLPHTKFSLSLVPELCHAGIFYAPRWHLPSLQV